MSVLVSVAAAVALAGALLLAGAGSALAASGGDGYSGTGISLIPPTSSALRDVDSGGHDRAGSVSAGSGEPARISIIPPTSSAVRERAGLAPAPEGGRFSWWAVLSLVLLTSGAGALAGRLRRARLH